jgi:hypothetical protein
LMNCLNINNFSSLESQGIDVMREM